MQPARHSKLMEDLWCEASILESIVGGSWGGDMGYRTIGHLIIFVHKEFGAVKVLVSKTAYLTIAKGWALPIRALRSGLEISKVNFCH